MNQQNANEPLSSKARETSNTQARATWEHKAVGSHRAGGVEAGTPEYFENIRAYRYGYETPFIPRFFQYSDLKDKRVLEVGVGNGIDAVEMMRNGACYTGIDITTNHLELTRRYVELEAQEGRHHDVENIIQGDLLETELPGDYQVIYSFGVLHHIAHEADFLSHLKRLLSSNGQLRIAVYARFSFFNIWMNVMWVLRNRMKSPLIDWKSHLAEGSQLGDPVVIKIRHRGEVQALLEQAGFRVVKYARKGFVQGYLPVIGGFLKPDGIILNGLASILGWYHCFICERVD